MSTSLEQMRATAERSFIEKYCVDRPAQPIRWIRSIFMDDRDQINKTLEAIDEAVLAGYNARTQEVETARDQEAKLWFETWYSHYIAPVKPMPGEFGKFATERIQMTGYQRDHALSPEVKDDSK